MSQRPSPQPPSPPPPRVSARAILAASREIRRRKQWPLFQQLEHEEPELADHVLESLSEVHQTLLESGAPHKVVRRLQRQIQSVVLVTVISVRAAYAADTDDSPATQGDL